MPPEETVLPGDLPQSEEAQGPPPPGLAAEALPRPAEAGAATFSLEGLIRDERGVRVAPEAED